MDRSKLSDAWDIDERLQTLEDNLSYYTSAEKFTVTGTSGALDLQNYGNPSRIGQCFREVRAAIISMLNDQIESERKALELIGVSPTT